MVLHCLVPLWKKKRGTELILFFLLQQWYQLGIKMARFVNVVRKQQIKAVTIRRTGFLKDLQRAMQDADQWVRTEWHILESRCIGNVLVIQEFKWEMAISHFYITAKCLKICPSCYESLVLWKPLRNSPPGCEYFWKVRLLQLNA